MGVADRWWAGGPLTGGETPLIADEGGYEVDFKFWESLFCWFFYGGWIWRLLVMFTCVLSFLTVTKLQVYSESVSEWK